MLRNVQLISKGVNKIANSRTAGLIRQQTNELQIQMRRDVPGRANDLPLQAQLKGSQEDFPASSPQYRVSKDRFGDLE